MLQPIPQPADYGISLEHGFLPQEFPSTQLSDACYSPWEDVLASLPLLIAEKRIRTAVNELPVISASNIKTESEWQRAYTVLCFIAHGYIWADENPAERLPPSLSIPFLEVCAHLGTLPTISYSALCLWNFRLHQNQDISDPDNIVALHTFTGTIDESWFYISSVAVEACGAPVIQHLLSALEAVRRDDVSGLTADLNATAAVLSKLGPLLQRVNEHLSPSVFYHQVRPFITGSQSLPKGLIYDVGSGKEEHLKYGGGSAAQSSLVPFCDTVLGVEHGDENKAFVKDMRNYMPGSHRRFLEDVAVVSNVKEFVQAHKSDSALQEALQSCYDMLKAFRNKHINVVTRYIVLPAKAAARKSSGTEGEKNLDDDKITGTAGAELIPFLKQMRDDTKE
jgi:indoleamine 2,3-dioxygenase